MVCQRDNHKKFCNMLDIARILWYNKLGKTVNMIAMWKSGGKLWQDG